MTSSLSPSAARTGVPASTVHAVLVRCRLNRWSLVDLRTAEVIRRHEHEAGSLSPVDVTELGNTPDGGGWRYVGRAHGQKNRAATAGEPCSRHRGALIGTAAR